MSIWHIIDLQFRKAEHRLHLSHIIDIVNLRIQGIASKEIKFVIDPYLIQVTDIKPIDISYQSFMVNIIQHNFLVFRDEFELIQREPLFSDLYLVTLGDIPFAAEHFQIDGQQRNGPIVAFRNQVDIQVEFIDNVGQLIRFQVDVNTIIGRIGIDPDLFKEYAFTHIRRGHFQIQERLSVIFSKADRCSIGIDFLEMQFREENGSVHFSVWQIHLPSKYRVFQPKTF